MASVFEENLAVLRRRHPQSARELESVEPRGPVEYPLREGVAQEPVMGALVILGLGCPGLLTDLWRKHQADIDLLLVLEPDSRRARAAFSEVSLVSILEDARAHVFVGTPPEDLRRTLNSLRYRLGNVTPTILESSPVSDNYRRILEEELILLRQNAELIVSEKGRMLFNCLRNLPVILSATPVQSLQARCAGEPAFVVAAGPSLDKNIAELRDARDHGWVIAVDTALGPLRKAGIEPQFIVTFDPSQLNERHFSGWPPLGQTILAFHPEVYWEIPRNYFGKAKTLVLHDGENRLLSELGLSPQPGRGVPRGIMTGHLAFNLAVYLGCDPIVLVGMDLAFPDAGGWTHATGATLGRQIGDRRGLRVNVGAISEKLPGFETDLIELPGMHGECVYAPPIFGTYLTIMEQEIARSGRRVIDATQGGTRKRGTEILELKDVIRSLSSESQPVNPRSRPPQNPELPPLESILSTLTGGRERLMELKQWAAEPHAPAEWRERLTRNPDDWLLPVYEFLIYRLYEIPRTEADAETPLRTLAGDLRDSCGNFNLFIQGTEQETRTLYSRL